MDTSIDALMKIIDFIKQILKVVNGGPLYWILTALLTVGAGIIYFFVNKAKKKVAWEKSQQQAQEEQAGGKLENDIVSEAAEKAENAVKQVQEQNPSTGKKPRPPREKEDHLS